jgi:hypothetical protein
MRGMEFKLLLAIILFFVFLVLIMAIFIPPAMSTEEQITPTRDFYYYCIFWSERGYAGTTFTVSGEIINMNKLCSQHLGILCFDENGCMPEESNDPDGLWEKCRSDCRLRRPGS